MNTSKVLVPRVGKSTICLPLMSNMLSIKVVLICAELYWL
jgi:hypothetical protein